MYQYRLVRAARRRLGVATVAVTVAAAVTTLGSGVAEAAPKRPSTPITTTITAPYDDGGKFSACSETVGTATCSHSASGNASGAVSAAVEVNAPAPGGGGTGEALGTVREYSYQLTAPVPAVEVTTTFHVAQASAAEDTTGGDGHSVVRLEAFALHSMCTTCEARAVVKLVDSQAGTAEPGSVTNQDFTVTYQIRNSAGGSVPAGQIDLIAYARSIAQLGYLIAPCGCAGSNFPSTGWVHASLDATVTQFAATRLSA